MWVDMEEVILVPVVVQEVDFLVQTVVVYNISVLAVAALAVTVVHVLVGLALLVLTIKHQIHKLIVVEEEILRHQLIHTILFNREIVVHLALEVQLVQVYMWDITQDFLVLVVVELV
jgi:hypothetical protein